MMKLIDIIFLRIKMIKKIIINESRLATFVLFMVIFAFFLRGIWFSDGIFLGGDWGFPATEVQVNTSFNEGFSTWTNQGNLFGTRQLSISPILFQLLIKTASLLNIKMSLFYKIMLVFLLAFSSFSMYLLLIFLRISHRVAFIGGLFYATSPIFFNYSIMGWQFAIFSMSLMPIAAKYFIRSVHENKIQFSIIAGIFYTVSAIQAQSVFWFFIIFLSFSFYLIKDKKIFLIYCKNLLIVTVLFFLLNAYWILGLAVSPDQGVIGSDIVNSSVSLGTSGNFHPINIIRLFGSLFNFQFENAINNYSLDLFSFVIAILAFSSLLIKENKKILIGIWLLGLFPVLLYFLNNYRFLLLKIPFANIIRDFSRFTVLSTFSYVILAALALNYFFKNKNYWIRFIGLISVILWLISIFPWWSGNITDWKNNNGSDMRLRIKDFPKEFQSLENMLVGKKLDQKAVYFPLGGILDFEDDLKFHGAYNETWDIFAGYSPIPGMLGLSDRGQGYLTDYIRAIRSNLAKNLPNILYQTNAHYFVIRKNVSMMDKEEIIDKFNSATKNEKFEEYFNEKKIIVYKKNDFLPHFYTSKNNIVSNKKIDDLINIVSSEDYDLRLAVFFERQNPNKNLEFLKGQASKNDEIATAVPHNDITLEFKKINPTKYRVRVHRASGKFPLVFSESFHDGWKSYLVKQELDSRLRGNDNLDKYKILDGNEDDQVSKYELKEYIDNGWVTELGDLKEKTIEHKKWEDNKETLDYVEKYSIDFISKNFQGTIQNDNLPKGRFYETWLAKKEGTGLPRFARNDSVIELPEENHLMANGYANSWVIDTDSICNPKNNSLNSSGANCVRNPDGSYDFELVIEFWPQRLFYIGLFISGITLFGCLVYLGYIGVVGFRNRKLKKFSL